VHKHSQIDLLNILQLKDSTLRISTTRSTQFSLFLSA
jgi:hypothetical protein